MDPRLYNRPDTTAEQSSGALDFPWAETMARDELPVGDTIFARTDSIIDFGYGTVSPLMDFSGYNRGRRQHNAAMGMLFGSLPDDARDGLRNWANSTRGAEYPVIPAYPMAIVSMAPQGGTGQVKGVVLHRSRRVAPYDQNDCVVVWFDGVSVGQGRNQRVDYVFPLNMRPGQTDVEIPGSDGGVEVRFSRTGKGEVLIERPGFVGQTHDANGNERPSMRVRYNRRFTHMQQVERAIGWLAAFFA